MSPKQESLVKKVGIVVLVFILTSFLSGIFYTSYETYKAVNIHLPQQINSLSLKTEFNTLDINRFKEEQEYKHVELNRRGDQGMDKYNEVIQRLTRIETLIEGISLKGKRETASNENFNMLLTNK